MPRERRTSRRRVCFLTGTRAEFGLMESTLRAIRAHPKLDLQLIVTGTHTHASRGMTVDEIRRAKWRIDRVIDWKDSADPNVIAQETGRVSGEIARALAELNTDVAVVVGDRVEAFAAASAAHLSGLAVAHVHGGDRAMGQVDDALRHAISKLSHIHFAATPGSAKRLFQLGEDGARIHVVGAPGVDGIRQSAATRAMLRRFGIDHAAKGFALLLLHPTDASSRDETKRTRMLVSALRSTQPDLPIIGLMPNNDPGAAGIETALQDDARNGDIQLYTHISRRLFLGLLRDCRFLVGNSSAGILEAGSFGTLVVNIGPRQKGRERGGNVIDAGWTLRGIGKALKIASSHKAMRATDNPYDRGGAGRRIASILATTAINHAWLRKLIRY